MAKAAHSQPAQSEQNCTYCAGLTEKVRLTVLEMGHKCPPSGGNKEVSMNPAVTSHSPSKAQISKRLDALDKEWSPRRPAKQGYEYSAFIFDECPVGELAIEDGEDCECFGWDWSDLFHARAAFSGSRKEVKRWLAQSKIERTQGYAVCFTDEEGWPLV
jgi:hypothetical protein